MDGSRPALAVSWLPRAAYECAPAPPARSHRSGTRRYYQARRCSYPAAQLCHPSLGTKDRYPGHPGAARSRDILPANTRSRGGFTIRSIPGAARPCSLFRQYAYRGTELVVIPQPDGSVACIPAWMTHESAAHHQLGTEPRLLLDILRSLRAEIDALLAYLRRFEH